MVVKSLIDEILEKCSLSLLPLCLFPAWSRLEYSYLTKHFIVFSRYFPGKPYTPSRSTELNNILAPMEDYLRASRHWVSKEQLLKRPFFQLHIGELLGDTREAQALLRLWPSLQQMVVESPEQVCSIFGLVRHHLASRVDDEEFPMVWVHLVGLKQETPLSALSSQYLEHLVMVEGTVVHVAAGQSVFRWLEWRCSSCQAVDRK